MSRVEMEKRKMFCVLFLIALLWVDMDSLLQYK